MKRFWGKVDRGDPVDCWLWTASRAPKGYGHIWIDGRVQRANRVAYELTHGPIPDGQMVRHKCDNPACCNPAHLELGTNKDNMRDRAERGRTSRGEHRPASKLTTEQVAEIRARFAAGGATIQALANDYSIHRSQISRIINHKAYLED